MKNCFWISLKLRPTPTPWKDLNEKALVARLRRAVGKSEKTGRCAVPMEIHDAYTAADFQERLQMARMLAASNFDKGMFVERMRRTLTKNDINETEIVSGWYTKKQMKDELNMDATFELSYQYSFAWLARWLAG